MQLSPGTIQSRHFTDANIPYIEQQYNAQFVLESCINTKLDGTGKWVNNPYLIFYTPIAHPQGSNWFAIGYENSKLIIRDGQSVYNADQIQPTLNCLYDELTNNYYTSTYRNDFNSINLTSNFIDGGRDYCHCDATNLQIGYITIALENNQPILVFTPY